jgi:nucleoside-diphosphate-sugar epimerase
MVTGNGLLAKRFASYQHNDHFLIFASGVSNSKTKNPDAYHRETALLQENLRQHPEKIIVYFSTCSVYDPEENRSPYVLHKLHIEKIIREQAKQYFIFRVSNVAGHSPNPNTLLNYFFYHIRNGINFDCWTHACRNIIDIDDVFEIADQLLTEKGHSVEPVNIASTLNYPVKEIISEIEAFLGTKSNYVEVNKGTCFDIDLSAIQPILQRSPKFGKDYLGQLLIKYFKKQGDT